MDLMKEKERIQKLMRTGNEFVIISMNASNLAAKQTFKRFCGIRVCVEDGYKLSEIESISMPIGRNPDSERINQILAFIDGRELAGFDLAFDLCALSLLFENAGVVDWQSGEGLDLLSYASCVCSPASRKFPDVFEELLSKRKEPSRGTLPYVRATAKMLEALSVKYDGYVQPSTGKMKLKFAKPISDFQMISLTFVKGPSGAVYYDSFDDQWHIREAMEGKICIHDAVQQFRAMYLAPFGLKSEKDLLDQWAAFGIQLAEKKTKKKPATKKTAK